MTKSLTLTAPSDESLSQSRFNAEPEAKVMSDSLSASKRSRESDAPESKWLQWQLKRMVDVTASLGGLIVLSPMLLVVMLLIKMDSPGPCLIRQRRMGYLGQEFYMYKFRTMVNDANKQIGQLMQDGKENRLMVKMQGNDPRITRIGKWLRKFSIDELPQLWNILVGEMSLVGPRPLLIENVKKHRKSYLRRLATLPGLTCYWQISGRSEIREFEQVLALDERYIQKWNILKDFEILLKTIPVVIQAKGAM